MRSLAVFGHLEDRESLLKVHRKPIVRLVDKQIVGRGLLLVQKIFHSVHSRELKFTEQNTLVSQTSPPPFSSFQRLPDFITDIF
jgi:hypothetical protein